jgi:hypothetical protein
MSVNCCLPQAFANGARQLLLLRRIGGIGGPSKEMQEDLSMDCSLSAAPLTFFCGPAEASLWTPTYTWILNELAECKWTKIFIDVISLSNNRTPIGISLYS